MSGVVVIKIGGRALEGQAGRDELWKALLTLHGAKGVVLVHGGGAAVDRQLERLGMNTEKRDGVRITPPEQVEQIAGVLAGMMNKRLVGAINRCGGRAVGLCLGDGKMTATRAAKKYGFDAGRVGEVVACEGSVLTTLLNEGFLPVVCSIGLDEAGEFLNVNADDAATGLARGIGARELVLLTDVEGIRDGSGNVERLTGARIEQLIAAGVISGGMVVKARAAAETARAAGIPVTIVSGETAEPLERWTRGETVGTRVFREMWRSVLCHGGHT